MALTRAQLLMGNDTQGAVLPGEVQAVKQGAGVLIGTDGTISVDASSVVGLVKLNNAAAFNGYVWPSVSGTTGQVLTKGTGNTLTWSNSGVFVSGSAPLNPEIGDLWFNCTVGELLVYEACTTGAPQWTSGTAGLPVLPGDTSASPAFASGSGTFLDPYICVASSASVSGTIVVNRVTVTDLAPFQFVNIVDLAGVVNGGRFSFTNNVANASGILVFDILFTDSPTSTVGTTYTCQLKIGSGTVYVNAPVTMTSAFVINSPGSISGSGQIGTPFTYTTGTAAGGTPPIVYTWTWKLFSTNAVLQQNGATYTPLSSQLGDSVYVTLTATDNVGQVVTGSTADSAPISKAPFPNPTPPTIPTTIGVSSTFIWDGAPTTLSSDGCLLFDVAGGPFSGGPTAVGTSQTVSTKWSDSTPGNCGNATTGTFIEGCLFDASFSACSSLTIDRIPNAYAFDPTTTTPSGLATSTPITITGNNAPGFITVGSGSDGLASSYQASIAGGAFQNVPAAGNYSLPILSGQTLAVRFTVGASALTTYNFNVQIGDSTGSTNATFAVTTTNSNFPTTPITFPTSTSGTGSVGTSVAWGNGTTNITGTGCIEFSVDGGSSYTQLSTSITDGVLLKTRYKAGATCADNTNGQTIVGGITNSTFTESTSLQIDRVPTAVTIATVSGATTSTQYTTSVLPTTGFNSTGYVTLEAGATLTSVQASIGGGAFAAIPSSGTTMPIEPGQSIQIRGTTGASFSTDYTAQINMGVSGTTTASTWTVQVGVAVPAIATPSIATPSDGATGVGTSSGITLTSSTYSASGGAGTHASSSWQLYAANEYNPETSSITAITSTPTFPTTLPRSVRFVGSQLNYMERSATAQGDRKKWTWSCWVKKAALATAQGLFVGGNVAQDQVNFTLDNGSNKISFSDVVANTTVASLVTTVTYTDCTQWVNIVLAVDTTSIVSSNRIKLYVNGVQVTSFDTAQYYPVNSNTSLNSVTPVRIGVNGITLSNYLSSYLSAVTFVDGAQLLPTSFGAQSGSEWVPEDYTGTFGTNGFKLLFGTDTTAFLSASSIGNDSSGNANNFAPVGLYSGNVDFDRSFGWFGTNLPTSACYLAHGCGGGGGGDDSRNPATGGSGGGGSGVITGSIPITSGTLCSAPYYINRCYTFNGQTVTPGTGAARYQGGPSGGPQFCPGGPTQAGGYGGGGGGGAGGGGGSGGRSEADYCPGAGGPGIASTVTGISVTYGAGGGGSPNTGGPGSPANNCFLFSQDPTKTPPTLGAYVRALPLTAVTANGVTLYSYGAFPQANSGATTTLNDWLTDTPTPSGTDTGVGGEVTGNYAVLNPARQSGVTLSNGNLNYSSSSGSALGSLEIAGGKYYWEVQVLPGQTLKGLAGLAKTSISNASLSSDPGATSDSYAYNLATGQVVTNGGSGAYGSAFAADDVLGVAFDADSGDLYFAKNNVWQNGGNPLTSLNPAVTNLTSGPYNPIFGGNTLGGAFSVNFGQRPFVYTAPSGFKVLVENPTVLALALTDGQSLSDIVPGDALIEVGGDASGVATAIDTGANTISVTNVVGTWTVGSTIRDTSRTIPVGPPTTDPPDPLNYFLIASATNSAVDLTSFSVAKPPLDPLVTYYARVQYKSNAVVTTSTYSPFSGFTTGSL